jgi:TFIIF-interacting CTD phosphatase-like protein
MVIKNGKFQFNNVPKENYALHFYALGNHSKTIYVQATVDETVTLGTIRLGS